MTNLKLLGVLWMQQHLKRMNISLHKALTEADSPYYDLFYRYIAQAYDIIDSKKRDEIVREAFSKVMEEEDQVDDEEKIKSLLQLAVDNICRAYIVCPQKSSEENSPGSYEEKDFMKLIYEEIEKLPEQRRKIVRMLYYEELSSKKVAAEMHLSEQTVRNQKAKAFKTLRKIVSGKFFL